ncbi:eukaryotic-type carbonic anhydrase domain-containing protein [Ditylenchus destructor]|nr:eukaryotic-type carbonic anhydrase domain-containing protein [Ditylenchus destructor]
MSQANKTKQNLVPLLNKCTQHLDSLGKIIQNVDRKQSPIDLLPSITAFDPALEGASFKLNYDETCQLVVQNLGSCVSIKYPDSSSSDLEISFFPGEQFHLEQVNFHWGTEPMNGSEHTVGGVGYAGEVHLIHRNLKYPNLDAAYKQPDGVVAFAVFLNESHDDNGNLIPLTKVLSQISYSGSETGLTSFRVSQLVPGNEKNKEFWVYEGSETIEPLREVLKFIVFRAAVPISSIQLETLRELRRSRAEDEVEEKMVSIRPLQSPNSRVVRSSFKSVAQLNDITSG